MNNTYDYFDYHIIKDIDSSTSIVKNNTDNKIMIRKYESVEVYPVLSELIYTHSPYLMKVYASRISGDICETLYEYIEGKTLDEIISEYGVYNEKAAKIIIISICDGLSDLHRRNIIHKDIKPENIMINKNGNIKIIDYNISRIRKNNQTHDTKILGTIGYAAPEHFGFSQSDETTDIYSCGVLLNYLLTGKLPDENLYKGPLSHIIKKCIMIDKSQRYQNAYELKLTLLGKEKKEKKNFRPLPGYRGKRIFPKILMTILLIVYFFFLYMYIHFMITQDPGISSNPLEIQLLNFFIIFVFFTALPYIFFGDIGRLSEKINPKNPKNGKYVVNIFGILSFVIGIILFMLQIK